ncbi:MAG: hypothetical protein GW886_13930 [Rhodobacterales bacterium]|nr:hypothetical protein [Rhodobacterales bacterium]
MTRGLAIACALALLAACDDSSLRRGDTLVASLPAAGADTCGATALAYLIGKPYQIAQSAPSLPANSRIYGEGDAVSMDYSENRLNVVHAADGIVQRISCG